MGVNKELFERHPFQVDGVQIDGDHHVYVRSHRKTRYPNKKGHWPPLADGSYLCVMEYAGSGEDTTSYWVRGARPIPLPVLVPLNALLYKQLLARDAAGADIEEDPLFLEAIAWITDTEFDGSALRRRHEREHEQLIEQYAQTGVKSPRLEFVSGWRMTFADVLEDLR